MTKIFVSMSGDPRLYNVPPKADKPKRRVMFVGCKPVPKVKPC